jgi:hypothetical protein
MTSGISRTRPFDAESRSGQLRREAAGQVLVQPTDVNAGFTETPVDAQHVRAARGELEAARMIESVAGDVQRPVLAIRLQPFETE